MVSVYVTALLVALVSVVTTGQPTINSDDSDKALANLQTSDEALSNLQTSDEIIGSSVGPTEDISKRSIQTSLQGKETDFSAIFGVPIKPGESKTCHVKNVALNEYLYAESFWYKDAWGRSVYTWTPGSTVEGSRWTFTRQHGPLFTVQNPYYYNEYLTAWQDGTVRTLATEATWELEVSFNGNLLMKRHGNMYMGVHPNAVYRRILTMEPNGNNNKRNMWTLSCHQ